jgi:hypothetical protein
MPPQFRSGQPPQRGGEGQEGGPPPQFRGGQPPQRGGQPPQRGGQPPQRGGEGQEGGPPPQFRGGQPPQRGQQKGQPPIAEMKEVLRDLRDTETPEDRADRQEIEQIPGGQEMLEQVLEMGLSGAGEEETAEFIANFFNKLEDQKVPMPGQRGPININKISQGKFVEKIKAAAQQAGEQQGGRQQGGGQQGGFEQQESPTTTQKASLQQQQGGPRMEKTGRTPSPSYRQWTTANVSDQQDISVKKYNHPEKFYRNPLEFPFLPGWDAPSEI